MKSTGIVRKIDSLGRFVIPIELRNVLDISTSDAIEIFTDEDRIILKKYQPACIFCGNAASNYLCARCAIVTWVGLCVLSLVLFAIIMYFYFRFNNKDKKKSPKK